MSSYNSLARYNLFIKFYTKMRKKSNYHLLEKQIKY